MQGGSTQVVRDGRVQGGPEWAHRLIGWGGLLWEKKEGGVASAE